MDEATFGEVRDAVRRFVREKVLPREDEIEETDAIPADLRAAAADLGLFGYALPAEYGGSGVSMAQDVRLAFEFGYATPAFRSMFGTNNGIAGQVIAKFGSDAQKKAFLPALAAGEMVASFALTESEAGSSPAGLRTSARRDGEGPDGGDWVLSGTKRFITNAPLADLFVVFARTDPDGRGRPGHLGVRGRRRQPGADGRAERSQDGPARRVDRRGDLRRRPRARRPPDRRGGPRLPQRDDRPRARAAAHRRRMRRHRAADPGRVGRARRDQQAGRPAHRQLPAGPGDARGLLRRDRGGPVPGAVHRGRLRRRAGTWPPGRLRPSCTAARWCPGWPTAGCRSTAASAT